MKADTSLVVKRKELGMIKKGTIAYALLSSSDYPDVLLPVKCFIKDVYFVDLTLFYEMKIMMFYDIDTCFLLRHLKDLKFRVNRGAKGSHRVIKLPQGLKSLDQLNNYFNETNKETTFHIESCFVKSTKKDMIKMFNKIQDYLIFKHLRIAENLMNRSIYEGKLKTKNKEEFKIRMERGFNSMFSSNTEAREYFDLMYQSNPQFRAKLDKQMGMIDETEDI